MQALLGLQRRGETISIDPCIPTVWPEYAMEWTIAGTRYRFVVQNPDHASRGVASATLDGEAVDAGAIPLLKDGGEHEVHVRLGASAPVGVPVPTPGLAEQSGV